MEFNIQKFCEIMAQQEVTLSKISRLSQIDIGNLSRYKNGKSIPNLKTIGKIAKALEINPTDLLVERLENIENISKKS